MRQKLVLAGKGLICLMCTTLGLYAGRLGAYFILSRLFTATNMSQQTYSAAPAWLVYVWDNAQQIGNITALLFALGVLLYLTVMFPQPRTPLMGTHLFLGIMGMFVGYILVRLLISFDCVRDGLNGSAGALSFAEDILVCVCSALLLRACVGESVRIAFGLPFACAVSALLEAVVFTLLAGSFQPVLMVNGLLLGCAFEYIYNGHKTPLPEIMMSAGFRIGSRRLAGFPGIKVYPVSEPLITGGNTGLEGSLLLLTVLVVSAAMFLLVKRKESLNG